MGTQTRRKTPLDTARDAVLEQRGKLLEWETTKAAAETELARLESVAGDQVLDDPKVADKLPRQMQEQRDRIELANRAIAAQRDRVAAAERSYLLAEADRLEATVLAPARHELERHERRTEELLAQLIEHEGPGRFLTEAEEIQTTHDLRNGPVTFTLPKSARLQDAVAEAELPIKILRAKADGQDPEAVVNAFTGLGWSARPVGDLYPACMWGPESLVPAPAYLRTLAREEQAALAARNALQLVEQRVAELEAKLEAGDTGPGGVQDWTLAPRPDYATQLAAARAQRDRLREQQNLEEPGADTDRVSAATP